MLRKWSIFPLQLQAAANVTVHKHQKMELGLSCSSGSEENLTWFRVFIPPECLALHPALTSRALQTQLLGRRLLFCFDSETPHGGKKLNIAHLVGNKSLLDDAPVDFQLNQTAPAGDAPLVTLTSHTPARRTLRSRKFDSFPAFLSRLRTFVFF